MKVLKNPWLEDYDNVLTYHLLAAILQPLGFEDATWHNNTCPSLRWFDPADDEVYIDLWIDYRDQSKSENPNDGTKCIFLDAYDALDGNQCQQLGFEATDFNSIYIACEALQRVLKGGA